MTAEQLEAARAERMRQNGHGAVTIEDVRTWIEETGLCIFLPRSAQAGFTTPTFVEAIAGQRTTEPTLELIATAESLLVRLEAEGVAVRLNLAGQPGDQPDYVVASWVLPYIYALRGDRDWRRSPQLTGSRQVSQLAVLAAKQLDTANLNAIQIRDLLGREVTETAVLRALHELWKQLRIIPVVPEVGVPALWQPLRQRFQKAIAEGASTSQVTAISVLASIYLQAVIAASMEDVELFLSPLTSRSKIREVVRGLAATRQVHSTTMGPSPMYYVAGTLPEFPVAPSFQISNAYPAYRGSTYIGTDPDQSHDEEFIDFPIAAASVPPAQVSAPPVAATRSSLNFRRAEDLVEEPSQTIDDEAISFLDDLDKETAPPAPAPVRHKPAARAVARPAAASAKPTASAKPAPRPRSAGPAHPRERSRSSASGDARPGSDRRRAPMPRSSSSNGSARPASASRNAGAAKASGSSNGAAARNGKAGSNGHHSSNGHAANGHGTNGNGSNGHGKTNGAHVSNGSNGSRTSKGSSGSHAGKPAAHTESRNGSHKGNGFKPAVNGKTAGSGARPSRPRSADSAEREPAKASATKRYSFSGSAKQAPKPAARPHSGKPVAKSGVKPVAKPAGKFVSKAASSSNARSASASKTGRNARPTHTANAKRRG